MDGLFVGVGGWWYLHFGFLFLHEHYRIHPPISIEVIKWQAATILGQSSSQFSSTSCSSHSSSS